MKANRIVALATLLTIVLSGCGGTVSSSSSSPQSSSSSSSSTSSIASSSSSTYVELNTSITDGLTLTGDYTGKTFDANAIGRVTLLSCIDGDTATFSEGSLRIRLRFNGINTPESTGKIDPWGKTASRFTCQQLQSAVDIVLENELDVFEKFDSSGSRYMGWVWYRTESSAPFRLLNLELVELAFSRNFMFDSNSRYFNEFRAAQLKTENSSRRVYGEVDPSYDYSTTAQELTLKEIISDFETYEGSGTKLRVEVLVQKFVGSHMFVRDVDITEDEETGELDYGAMYVYAGYNSGLATFIHPGDIIQFYCRAGSFNGSMQLADVVSSQLGREALLIKSTDNPITVEDVDSTTDFSLYLGKIVSADVTIQHVGNQDDSGNYTIYADIAGTETELNIRVNAELSPNYGNLFVVGDTYRVQGGLVKYETDSRLTYQILLGNNVGNAYQDAYRLTD